MKYMLLLLALHAALHAHSQCSEVNKLLQKGDNYLKGNKPNYEEAINAYTAAILACGERASEGKQRISRMVNEIKQLKENAVVAERKAIDAQREAQAALQNLKKANEDFVQRFLQNARKDMSDGRYEDALEKIKTADGLGVLKKEVCNAYLENADSSLLYSQFEVALESIKAAAAFGILPSEKIGRACLDVAEKSILHLQYEVALEGAKAAATLGILNPEVSRIYLEIAFWHGEAGNSLRVTAILDSTALLVGKKTDTSQPHRKAIEALDPAVYKKLMERYYPVMVSVEGGTFDMGCDPGDTCKNLHKQEVSSFQMAKYETTWWQYLLFCKATGRGYVSPGWSAEGDNPAVNISWYDAAAYCNWVSRQLGKTEIIAKDADGNFSMQLRAGYRLPTEAEWEYAAGGGVKNRTRYAGTDDEDQLKDFAWYDENSDNRTRPVGSRKANPLGLHDLSGNVWEWCWDWYGDYPKELKKDYDGTPEGSSRVGRGGGWDRNAVYCRTADRNGIYPGIRYGPLGIRLVFVP